MGKRFWAQYGSYLAFAVALVATIGSLYYSEVKGFVPCELCWYQRILMYPLTAITLVGILHGNRRLPDYVLPFSVVGLAVSTYHLLLQHGIITHTGACASGIPCNGRYVNYFGFVTIPLMALTAFLLITAAMLWTRRAENGVDTDETEAGT